MQFSINLSYKNELRAGNGSLYYVVSYNGEKHRVNSGYTISKKYWHKAVGIVNADKNSHARKVLFRTEWEMKQIINTLNAEYSNFGTVSLQNLSHVLHKIREKQSLTQFTFRAAENLRKSSRFRTAETYISSLKKFLSYVNARDVMLYEITRELIGDYENYLRSEGLSQNTSAFYVKTLRAIYNKAMGENGISETNPFKNAYTGVAETKKRAISCFLLHKLKNLDLEDKPHLKFARDLFFLSFYMRGISFIDLAYLKKTDLKNGYITYSRQKTGQKITIKCEKEMRDIFTYYPTKTPFLLPIIDTRMNDYRKSYLNCEKKVNRNIKKIGKMMKLSFPLTLYVARHSWATIAHDKGIPITLISEGLGHNNEKTTRIYISLCSNKAIDTANRKLISLI